MTVFAQSIFFFFIRTDFSIFKTNAWVHTQHTESIEALSINRLLKQTDFIFILQWDTFCIRLLSIFWPNYLSTITTTRNKEGKSGLEQIINDDRDILFHGPEYTFPLNLIWRSVPKNFHRIGWSGDGGKIIIIQWKWWNRNFLHRIFSPLHQFIELRKLAP